MGDDLEEKAKVINDELKETLGKYRNTMKYMAADAPIGVLCLDDRFEKILSDAGIFRVYDLFERDFTKIKGVGVVRARQLTSRVDEFLSMC